MPTSPLFHAVLETSMLLQAPPERVFPLLCPVREAEWIPGWSADILHSASGVAELGCVFRTRDEEGRERIWTVSRYEPEAGKIQFVQFVAGLAVIRLDIALDPTPEGCRALWIYTVMGLTQGRDSFFSHYQEAPFQDHMGHLRELLAAHLAATPA
jgi:hypothetical protein